ncbi:hypothetical protein R1sor_002418 [Riccia sorocarpa]|uniref:U6 snRNA-associated Sm-like protein LSm4 n=1 Tax=Riccia sorocarpa TaxID=122646 RepID=A0ABD3H0F3_9MARC
MHGRAHFRFGAAVVDSCAFCSFRMLSKRASVSLIAGTGSLQLPLSLLKTAQGHPMLVELKNGETYNGHLVNCDTWMNIHLREVICTSKDGDRFWRMPECYIRGNTIKYLRVPDEVIDKVQEETVKRPDRRPQIGGRGRSRGRGDDSAGRTGGRGGRGYQEEGGDRGGRGAARGTSRVSGRGGGGRGGSRGRG